MFRVEWLQAAVDELATIWINADSNQRRAITEAAHAIDQELEADPFRQSESRADDHRVFFVYPLAVLLEVDLGQRVVWIRHAWKFRRRVE